LVITVIHNEYLVDENNDIIRDDIKKSIEIFKDQLGKNSDFFSYPFGEYSLNFKNIIKSLGFKYAFGQHSGVIDESKDFYELPRFPINEKYGELKRFNSLTKTLPFNIKIFGLKKNTLLTIKTLLKLK
jgi:peptidoglycan/xylan/chitin deacetylase (PgdA/CDA1 family)